MKFSIFNIRTKTNRIIFLNKRKIMRKILKPLVSYIYEIHIVRGNPKNLQIGERVALANTLINLSSGKVSIGDRTIFAADVHLVTGQHLFRNGMRVSINPKYDDGSWGGGKDEVPAEGYDISIGSGCFIAVGAIIVGGVTIGNNCIVAAGAVVTKSFPDYSIIGGVPARRTGDTRKYGFTDNYLSL